MGNEDSKDFLYLGCKMGTRIVQQSVTVVLGACTEVISVFLIVLVNISVEVEKTIPEQ